MDQPLQVAPFAGLVQSLAGKLRGPAFPAVWQMFAASMHIETLPETAQELLRSSCQPRQDLVLAYWRELLDRPASDLAGFAAATLGAVRAAGVPYLVVAGDDLEPEYQNWLSTMLPQAATTVWPASGHSRTSHTPTASLSASPLPPAHPARHRATDSQHDQLTGPGGAATYQAVQSAGSICEDSGRPAVSACTPVEG